MTIPGLPPLSLALVILRQIAGPEWTQERLAAAAGRSQDTISEYERGRWEPALPTLQHLARVMGFASATVQLVVLYAGEICTSVREYGGDGKREIAAQVGRQAERLMFAALTRLEMEHDRHQARELWAGLKDLSPAARRRFFGALPELCTWAVVEVFCAESERAAAHSAGRALELAGQALWIAGQLPPNLRRRAQAYAWGFVGNARRVGGNLPEADEAFILAVGLWPEDSDDGDPCPLRRSRLLDLEASLRKDQRRPLEALELLKRAARTPDLTAIARARLLIKKANALEILGDYESAVAALREAAPAVEASQEPRLVWILRFTLANCLCYLDRATEAHALLPGVRLLAAQIGNGLDTLRFRWLESRVLAGLGQIGEAIEALASVRADFVDLNIAYDGALATSELAVLYLEIGRTAEVKALTRQSLPIFRAEGILPEEQKALALFREAVERETVTLALARRLVTYLQRARFDSRACFEE